MTPRKRERRWAPFVATVAVTAFLAVSGVFGATAAVPTPADPGAPTPAAVPAPKSLPAAMDNVAQYQGQSICDPPPKPGIAALKNSHSGRCPRRLHASLRMLGAFYAASLPTEHRWRMQSLTCISHTPCVRRDKVLEVRRSGKWPGL